MKTLFTLFVSLLSLVSISAQNNIETQSITLDHLITFVANYFPLDVNEDSTKANNTEEVKTKQISFILETSKKNFAPEDKIILQQAFKFLTTRLNTDDKVSVFAYSGQNGLLLDRVLAKDIKKMLSVINDVKSNITKTHVDGIAMAYKYAQENYNPTADNIIVMVRNPNAVKNKLETSKTKVAPVKEQNKSNNAVLLTAITLLPELISIIKD